MRTAVHVKRASRDSAASSRAPTTGSSPTTLPYCGDIRADIRNGDGAIAYWNDQRLKLPAVARQLGETGDYAHIRAVAIPAPPTDAQYRHIYLLMRDHGRYRWFTMEAFDLQDICIEGHIQS